MLDIYFIIFEYFKDHHFRDSLEFCKLKKMSRKLIAHLDHAATPKN